MAEIVWLAGAGLTPLEALQAATLKPAKIFEATDSLGAVAQGKLADLVLLDADPLVMPMDTERMLASQTVPGHPVIALARSARRDRWCRLCRFTPAYLELEPRGRCIPPVLQGSW